MPDPVHSMPPPASALPPVAPNLTFALEHSRGRRRLRAEDELAIAGGGLSLMHGRFMKGPLELPLTAVKVATVDPGPAKVSGLTGRFAVLRRLSATTVVPRSEGIDGWLWTSTGGTGLTALGEADEAPNLALMLAKPLDEAAVRAAFLPEVAAALAARSPLGSPTVLGLLFRVADTIAAEQGLKRWGFESVLTDREVPPTLRRHLPTDKPANPVVGRGEDRRAGTSFAPPGAG
jgi:hypothetical protein